MYIDCVTNSGKPYLRVAESYSVVVDGVRKNRKRTIRNIGSLSRFDDGMPDFLQRLKKSFKEGKPIIAGLDDLLQEGAPPNDVVIRFHRDNAQDYESSPKNIGYFLLDGLYDALGIYDVLNRYKSDSKLEYDLNGIAKLLVFGRILWPDSKIGTFEERDRYLFDVTSSQKPRQLYHALDCLDNTAQAIQNRMNTKIKASLGRNTEICYYDVTNFWFEIDHNDEDMLTLDGQGL